jgi:hypothetical protein
LAIIFRRSAERHGISRDRATFVITTCPGPLYAPDDEPALADRVLFLGPDASGVPLEVIGIELNDGDLVVIHAMRMRRRYERAYAQVMQWR